MTASLPPYQLAIDGIDPSIIVHSFLGTETLSEAWWFELVVTAPAGDDIEQAALGQRATLIWNHADKQRAFYGVVAAVRLAEVHHLDDAVQYVVRVVPRLWLLKRKTRTRIFQNMRVPDIVSAVLLEAGITTRWQLVRAYPEREYCTQYEETDYRFVRRLLAEAGIYFYFFGGGPVAAAAPGRRRRRRRRRGRGQRRGQLRGRVGDRRARRRRRADGRDLDPGRHGRLRGRRRLLPARRRRRSRCPRGLHRGGDGPRHRRRARRGRRHRGRRHRRRLGHRRHRDRRRHGERQRAHCSASSATRRATSPATTRSPASPCATPSARRAAPSATTIRIARWCGCRA